MAYVNIMDASFRAAFEERQLAPVQATPTPFDGWNRCCGDDGGRVGLAKGWLTIIGGNPKFGKSILALAMAARAMMEGETVGFISLEMKAPALAARLYSIMTSTPIWKLEKVGFTEAHFRKVWKDMAPLQNEHNFLVNDDRMYELKLVQAAVEDMRQDGVEWLVIDYLQLCSLGDDKKINQAVGETTNWLHAFARETETTVIALSQFNRETSKNYHDTPMPQGLHGGMIIEATADQIMLIDHSRFERTRKSGRTWLVLTNRHGPHGEVPIEWNYDTLRCREQEPHEEGTWPGEKKVKKP